MSGATAIINNGLTSHDVTRTPRGPASEASFAAMLGDAANSRIPLEKGSKVIPVELPREQALAIAPRGEHEAIPLRGSNPIDQEQLRDSARQLIASALLTPLLEDMDNSTLRPKEGPFSKNVVEKRFGPILHQHVADRMMQSRSFNLVDAVIKRMGGEVLETTA